MWGHNLLHPTPRPAPHPGARGSRPRAHRELGPVETTRATGRPLGRPGGTARQPRSKPWRKLLHLPEHSQATAGPEGHLPRPRAGPVRPAPEPRCPWDCGWDEPRETALHSETCPFKHLLGGKKSCIKRLEKKKNPLISCIQITDLGKKLMVTAKAKERGLACRTPASHSGHTWSFSTDSTLILPFKASSQCVRALGPREGCPPLRGAALGPRRQAATAPCPVSPTCHPTAVCNQHEIKIPSTKYFKINS